jgi:predicted TIM-barrel fold metal-dependent hydrolase
MTGSGIIDVHAHVFRPAAISSRGVDELVPADRDAPVEDLLGLMAGSGVDAAVLVPLDAHDDYVARVRGVTFVTRNTADVERTGVALLDPFSTEAS